MEDDATQTAHLIHPSQLRVLKSIHSCNLVYDVTTLPAAQKAYSVANLGRDVKTLHYVTLLYGSWLVIGPSQPSLSFINDPHKIFYCRACSTCSTRSNIEKDLLSGGISRVTLRNLHDHHISPDHLRHMAEGPPLVTASFRYLDGQKPPEEDKQDESSCGLVKAPVKKKLDFYSAAQNSCQCSPPSSYRSNIIHALETLEITEAMIPCDKCCDLILTSNTILHSFKFFWSLDDSALEYLIYHIINQSQSTLLFADLWQDFTSLMEPMPKNEITPRHQLSFIFGRFTSLLVPIICLDRNPSMNPSINPVNISLYYILKKQLLVCPEELAETMIRGWLLLD